jgi:hypothetical protein
VKCRQRRLHLSSTGQKETPFLILNLCPLTAIPLPIRERGGVRGIKRRTKWRKRKSM